VVVAVGRKTLGNTGSRLGISIVLNAWAFFMRDLDMAVEPLHRRAHGNGEQHKLCTLQSWNILNATDLAWYLTPASKRRGHTMTSKCILAIFFIAPC
jgi:hypothetical protein